MLRNESVQIPPNLNEVLSQSPAVAQPSLLLLKAGLPWVRTSTIISNIEDVVARFEADTTCFEVVEFARMQPKVRLSDSANLGLCAATSFEVECQGSQSFTGTTRWRSQGRNTSTGNRSSRVEGASGALTSSTALNSGNTMPAE